MDEYLKKYYNARCTCCDDMIILRKNVGTINIKIMTKINDMDVGELTIRSKEQAEQLHFMLGQLLEK